MATRRSFVDLLGRFGLAGAALPWLPGCGTTPAASPPPPGEHFDLVVIGSGFGGSISALWIAYALEQLRAAGKPAARPLRILMLERGTWWTTSTETVQDKQVKTRDFLLARKQPTQEWSSLSDVRGMVDLIGRCRHTELRPQGLFDFVPIGKRGLFNLRNDGVSVLRASGVGGGSLIYSKILLRPPETLFDDPRWPAAWRGAAAATQRDRLYATALTAVGVGVETLFGVKASPPSPLTGPSQILMRVPGITPASIAVAPPSLQRADRNRVIWQIKIKDYGRPLTERQGELIDRARIFQSAMASLTDNYGSVELSINDMDFAPPPKLLARAEQASADRQKALRREATNVCERHGRCNIGCLPGAGQTLNKQLMRAVWGAVSTASIDRALPDRGECLFKTVGMELRALAQVDLLSERAGGGYLVHWRQRRPDDPAAPTPPRVLSADRVIVAAGSLGSAELMLRCQQRAAESGGAFGLRGLSAALGDGFSPNGDYIAFLPETRERVNLTFGPVTTSYAQFNADKARADGFHQIEDQGVPRALSALAGHGMPVIRRLAEDDGIERYVAALGQALKAAQQIFTQRPRRTYPPRPPHDGADLSADRPEAEDELTSNMMCIVAQGKDLANGRFRLENDRLRLDMPDARRFHEDPIYEQIRGTLDKFAAQLRPDGRQARFLGPLSDVKIPFTDRSVLTSHPLGGCRMAESVERGVVDDAGRVFRQASAGGGFHTGLYITDGSVLPTALGVNPALTISAVALRVAEKVLAEWGQIGAHGMPATGPLPCEIAAPLNV